MIDLSAILKYQPSYPATIFHQNPFYGLTGCRRVRMLNLNAHYKCIKVMKYFGPIIHTEPKLAADPATQADTLSNNSFILFSVVIRVRTAAPLVFNGCKRIICKIITLKKIFLLNVTLPC